MTFSELMNSVGDTTKERIASPLTGALIISWLLWNWRIVLVLLSTKPVEWKITYIDYLAFEGGSKQLWYCVFGPLITALFILLIYPVASIAIYRVWALYQKSFMRIEQDLRAERLVTREDFERFRQAASKEYVDNEDRLRRKDALIQFHKDESAALSNQIAHQSSELEELRAKTSATEAHDTEELTESGSLLNFLRMNQFVLVFNANHGQRGQKSMLFGPGGTILKGGNENEHTWQLKGSTLEFYNAEGDIFNRLYYHPGISEFMGTNEPALPALKNQRMYSA